tara:strand:+ start:237 stop:941 length:705 start_codon:yes stop_codon:yes gene_type:complete
MKWKDLALQHAKQENPKESCGLLVIVKGKEKYIPCKNLALHLDAQFMIDPMDWIKSEDKYGQIIGVVHSHPYSPPQPSAADLACCEKTNLTWHIISLKTETWYTFKPSGYKPPLIGRQWVWGVQDCWTLVRDFYIQKGLNLRDYARPKYPKDFQDNPIFDSCWKECGFRELNDYEDLQPNDALLLKIRSTGLNHVAVYVGNQKVLHHLSFRLSSHDTYDANLLKCTGRRLRYAS